MGSLLVVDDEEIVRQTILQIIHERSWNLGPVAEASNGEQAVQLARQLNPSIVLMDLGMPGLNGLTAVSIILSERPHTRIIVLTSYEEIFLAQEALELGAVDFISKPIRPDKLLKVLKRVHDQLQEMRSLIQIANEAVDRVQVLLPLAESRLLEDLVYGVAEQPYIDKTLACLEKKIRWPAVMVIEAAAFYVASLHKTGSTLTCPSGWISNAVQMFGLDPKCCLFSQTGRARLVAVLSTEHRLSTVEEIRSLGVFVSNNLKKHHLEDNGNQITLCVGIGNRCTDLMSIPRSYKEALQALNYSLYEGRDPITHINEIKRLLTRPPAYPIELERMLLASIHTGDQAKSSKWLEKLLDHLMARYLYHPEVLQTRLVELTALVSRVVIETGTPVNGILEEAHQQVVELAALQTRPDFHPWVTSRLSGLIKRSESLNHSSKIIEQALEYIDRYKFYPNIKLEDVAKAVHISNSHLAHLLKTRLGTTYLKHLTALRIKEAKRLLQTTHLTATAIAAQIGYEDNRYFHRVFLRETGVTPITYRQANQFLPKQ